jgi:hypothetical protein
MNYKETVEKIKVPYVTLIRRKCPSAQHDGFSAINELNQRNL